jgi:hypothetical protein
MARPPLRLIQAGWPAMLMSVAMLLLLPGSSPK